MDPDIKELQEEIKRVGALSADTNRIVHGMRRSQRWHSFFTIVWWVIIIGASIGSFYLIQPYINQATAAYGNAQGLQVQVQNFLAQFGSKTQ